MRSAHATIIALVLVLVSSAVACDRPIALAEGAIVQVSFDIPQDAQHLPAGSVVFATAEVTGLAAETPLIVNKGHASGSLGFAVEKPVDAPAILRVYGQKDAGSSPAILYLGTQTLHVAPGVELFAGTAALSHDVTDATPYLDLNRNGRDNLGDLAAGCDPSVPSSFVRVSATDVQFTAGVASRQVVVVDNLVQLPITVRADIVDAAGVGVAVLTAGAEQAPSLPTTGEVQIDAGGSLLLALSFTPANPFLTTGFLSIEAIDDVNVSGGGDATRCKTRIDAPVRIIANVDGGPRAAAAGAQAPVLATGASLGAGGFDAAQVSGFPVDNTASGAALGVALA
ncbi:MAG TPA: hypothetical protein VGO62_20955, partial [Myxococcota bacterium]